MKVLRTELQDVLILEPTVFDDERGFFYESWNREAFAHATGYWGAFVQDNHSRSTGPVLRGLHYQIRQAQGKLVRATTGSIFDVAVDLRRSSGTFGMWTGVTLSAANRRQLWIPPGFAHGFLVTGDAAEVQYKVTEFYAPDYDRTLLWNDEKIGIRWPLEGRTPILSSKDRDGVGFDASEVYE